MEMFKLLDLKNGMVVELNDGSRRLLWENRLIDQHGFIPLGSFNKHLINADCSNLVKIDKIYLTHSIYYLNDFFNDESLTEIWRRN
jgi:hypothetical protein